MVTKFITNIKFCASKKTKNLYNHSILSLGQLSLMVALFSISFPRQISLYALGISLLFGLFVWVKDYTVYKPLFFSRLDLIVWILAYFVLQSLSAFRGADVKLNLIEERLMFLLVPTLGFPIFINLTSKNKITFILKVYVLGQILAFVTLLSIAMINGVTLTNWILEIQTNPVNGMSVIVHENLSLWGHPSYLSLNVLFAIIVMVGFLKQEWYRSIVYLFTISILLVFLFLLSSRAALLALSFVTVIGGFRFLKKSNKSPFIKGVIVFAIVCFIGIVAISNSRIHSTIRNFMKYQVNKDSINDKMIEPRFRVWYSAISIIKDFPIFGVGLSNSRNQLHEKYEFFRFDGEAELHLDAHNQFLEDMVSNGIMGLVFLLLMLFSPIFKLNRLRFVSFYQWFILLFIPFLFFESMLNRQWGIMFFTLFYCISVIPSKSFPYKLENQYDTIQKVNN